ncbi:MFS superfamily sulfate permease-like transporter [Pontibacter aydingkolensis]|uniref:SulP family inorganic anion transporter n=1 Tax=Pontibacter aydingkolensis TaxID=1911536 RepID=A0ABS7CX63_9BACT|nr:SulP family inorganic anion transporter [Pontibacter aydingkolensis]MBW7468397.1 SulP family inorganic anion transporter [Pontibacter aydingkolensis]
MEKNELRGASEIKSGLFSHVKTDLPSGLVVFLIALPLCLGISLASGAPLFSGIIAGIVGGIVVGFVSGSKINVSGPAASVALVVLTAIQSLGSFQIVLSATIIAGIFQIILGYMRAGTIAYFFPSSMIKGILASIGLILIINQIPHAFGYRGEGLFGGMEDGFIENVFAVISNIVDYISLGATIITLVSLVIIFAWDQPFLKKYTFFRFVPSALIAVLVSIGINQLYKVYFPELALDAGHLVQLPVADGLAEFFSFFTFPDFSQITNPELYTVALSIAFIASLESLLSTEAGDKLDPYKRKTSTNRELKAQGIGNIVSGFIGGLPVTAVIVRTSANVTSGGRTPLSTITHGTLMLICVMTIPLIINMIPLASLSAVLFVVGYKLTSYALYKRMYKAGKRQFIPFIATILAVMFTDLITGIVIGGAVSAFIILRDNYRTPFFIDKEAHHEGEKVELVLSEEVTFLNKASIMLTLDHVAPNSEVVIDATRSVNIDDDVLEIIEEFRNTAAYKNIRLETIGLEKHLKKASA